MHFYEFIHMTHDVNRLWNFLYKKKVLRSEVICPRCEHLIKLNNVAENHIYSTVEMLITKSIIVNGKELYAILK